MKLLTLPAIGILVIILALALIYYLVEREKPIKTIIKEFGNGLKEAYNVPCLPDNIRKYHNKIPIRIARITGGIAVLITQISDPSEYNEIIVVSVTLMALAMIIYTTFIFLAALRGFIKAYKEGKYSKVSFPIKFVPRATNSRTCKSLQLGSSLKNNNQSLTHRKYIPVKHDIQSGSRDLKQNLEKLEQNKKARKKAFLRRFILIMIVVIICTVVSLSMRYNESTVALLQKTKWIYMAIIIGIVTKICLDNKEYSKETVSMKNNGKIYSYSQIRSFLFALTTLTVVSLWPCFALAVMMEHLPAMAKNSTIMELNENSKEVIEIAKATAQATAQAMGEEMSKEIANTVPEVVNNINDIVILGASTAGMSALILAMSLAFVKFAGKSVPFVQKVGIYCMGAGTGIFVDQVGTRLVLLNVHQFSEYQKTGKWKGIPDEDKFTELMQKTKQQADIHAENFKNQQEHHERKINQLIENQEEHQELLAKISETMKNSDTKSEILQKLGEISEKPRLSDSPTLQKLSEMTEKSKSLGDISDNVNRLLGDIGTEDSILAILNDLQGLHGLMGFGICLILIQLSYQYLIPKDFEFKIFKVFGERFNNNVNYYFKKIQNMNQKSSKARIIVMFVLLGVLLGLCVLDTQLLINHLDYYVWLYNNAMS